MEQQYRTLRTQTIPQVKEQTILAEVTAIELMLHLVEHVPVLLGRHHDSGRPARLKSHGTGANMCQQNLMAADTDTPDGMYWKFLHISSAPGHHQPSKQHAIAGSFSTRQCLILPAHALLAGWGMQQRGHCLSSTMGNLAHHGLCGVAPLTSAAN